MKQNFTNSTQIRKIWILCMLAVVHTAAIAQTSHLVDVTNNVFTPKELSIMQGDTVIWTNSEGNHNVNGTQSQWPSNPESFGNEVAAGWVFSHVFTLPGAYDYQCDPHVRSNMFGKISVAESTMKSGIMLNEDPALGSILTDSSGLTLYYYTKDAMPDTSLCSGGCLDFWPIFYLENPTLGPGLEMEDFGAIEHPEGGMQTTYKGWPLYYYAEDLVAGDTKGEAVSDVWFVAKPDYSIMLMDGLLIGKDGVTYDSNYNPGEEMLQYFVDEHGRSIYIFINDYYEQNNFTASDFSNNSVWPIYEEGLRSVPSILDGSLFSSIDVFGKQQLTYKGWPLYYFGEDAQRGETTGVSVPGPGIWPVAVQDLEEAPLVSSVTGFASQKAIRLYPNPARDALNIEFDGSIESVSIYSTTGARLKVFTNIQTDFFSLSLDGIETGVYILEVRSPDQASHVSRFVKR